MRLHLLHRTIFLYRTTARDSFNEARLQPIDGEGQRLLSFNLRTTPASEPMPFRDYFGNAAHRFAIAAPHSELIVEAVSEVQTEPGLGKNPLPQVPLRSPATEESFDQQVEFLQPSRYVPLDTELVRVAAQIVRPGHDVWGAALDICSFVHRSMVYRQQATGIETVATEALKLRAGVCQDFAHVALGLCRSAGIPARYVSGYFLDTERKPGEPEASHAWAEAWLPGLGWAPFDPTHNIRTDERYIRLAVGRDYADIRPIGGTYRGSATREMRVEVAVRAAEPIVKAGPD